MRCRALRVGPGWRAAEPSAYMYALHVGLALGRDAGSQRYGTWEGFRLPEVRPAMVLCACVAVRGRTWPYVAVRGRTWSYVVVRGRTCTLLYVAVRGRIVAVSCAVSRAVYVVVRGRTWAPLRARGGACFEVFLKSRQAREERWGDGIGRHRAWPSHG